MPSPCLLPDTNTIHLDDPSGVLQADVIFSPNAGNAAYDDGSGVYVPQKAIVTASIPGSPSEGDEIVYQVAGYTDHYWRLIYTSGHWRFIGGPPIVSRLDSDDSYTTGGSAGWTGLGGPTITLPYSGGHWNVAFGGSASWDDSANASGAAHAGMDIGLSIDGATSPPAKILDTIVDREAYGPHGPYGSTTANEFVVMTYGETEVAANSSLNLIYRILANDGDAHFMRRWVRCFPTYL